MPALLALLVGCQTEEFPAPIRGTAYRITDDRPAEQSELRVDVMANWRECADAKVVEIDKCVPRADRASGELHFSFRLRDPQSSIELHRAIRKEQIKVTHDGTAQDDYALEPREPIASGQLFILLIDGSGSMYENDQEKIRKVYSALLKPSVVSGFFPSHNPKTGVVLLRFSDKVTGLDGNPPRVVTSADDYTELVREHLLRPSGGFTHLYSAVEYSVTELLDQQGIRDFLTVKGAEPTLVVLTDGFNNQEAKDTCGDNAARLQETVDLLREVRTSQGGATRPTVYTVGLGLKYRPGEKPQGLNRAVTPRDLCGKLADFRIDGVLDKRGIDHVSLMWMAEAGGGAAFVKQQPKGLADVFEEASATRFRWYEVWYRVPDPYYHRRSFDVQLQLLAFERAYTTFSVLPSSWLDGPTGRREVGARWHEPTRFRHSLTILMPALGIILFLSYLGPAFFNARRGILRRARPRR